MGSKTPEEHFRRLSEAVNLYLEHREVSGEAASESRDPGEEMLEQNPELRDLLGPMLSDEAAEAPRDTESPRFFGDYELLREVGRGGMGVVFEALEVSLQRRIALKLLLDRSGRVATQIERFRREAAAAGRLQHPGIAAVHRVGEHDGTHFIAMELVDGPNLAEVVERLRQQSDGGPARAHNAVFGLVDGDGTGSSGGGYFAEVAELTARVAEALAYANDRGVVHRDVKPHNILLGGRSGVKLVDFGLAKDLDRDAVTRTGDIAGTPDYMSPEQVRGEKVDARTDVYSLGVVLYELLTWTRPFSNDATHATLRAILENDPVSVRRRSPHTPRDLETICGKAMEKDRDRRYASAAALAEDLRHFRRHEPILASPPTAASRVFKLVRRNRAGSLAAVFALLALVVAPIAFAFYFKHARDELATEQLETSRQRDLAASILTEARSSLDELYTWLAEDRLKSEPGMVDVRRELLVRALGFYERFCKLAGDDTSLQFETGLAQLRLGTILFDLREYDRAEHCLTTVLTSIPADGTLNDNPFELAIARAEAHSVMYAIANNRGQTKSAREHTARAFNILEPLKTRTHGQARIRLDKLARLHVRRSRRIVEFERDPPRAVAELDTAIAQWESIVNGGFINDPIRSALASALASRALLRARDIDPNAESDSFERATTLLQAIVEARPRSAVPRRKLARVLRQQSEALVRGGQAKRAVPCAARAVGLAASLQRDYPEFDVFRLGHVNALYDHAVALLNAEEEEAGLAELERAWPLACALAEDAPDQLAVLSAVGNIAGPLATYRRRIHGAGSEITLPLQKRAVQIFETAYEQHPESSVLLDLLGISLVSYGRDLMVADQTDSARATLERAADLRIECLAVHPGDRETVLGVRSVLGKLAELEIRAGRLDATARVVYRLVGVLPNEPHARFEAAKYMARIASAAANGTASDLRAEECGEFSMRWLELAVAGDSSLLAAIGADPAFEWLAGRAEFQALGTGR